MGERKISVLFLHTFDLMTKVPCAKLMANFQIFVIPLPVNMTLLSKSSYLTGHIKINYERGCIVRFSKKTQRCIQDHHDNYDGALCGIICSFQLLTNFKKSPNRGVMGFLNEPLEYYNVF